MNDKIIFKRFNLNHSQLFEIRERKWVFNIYSKY